MSMKKRILSLALGFVLTLALIPAAYAANTQTGAFQCSFEYADTTYTAFFEVTNVAGVWESDFSDGAFPTMHVFASAPATVKLISVTDGTGAKIENHTWKLMGTTGDTDPFFGSHIRAGTILNYNGMNTVDFSTEMTVGSSFEMGHGTRAYLFDSEASGVADGFLVWAFDIERTTRLVEQIPGGSAPIPTVSND